MPRLTTIPAYRFDPALAFPECRGVLEPGKNGQTTINAERPAAVMALTLAFLLKGQQFASPKLSMVTINAEIEKACQELGVPMDRLLSWADSILLPPEETLTSEEADAVPRASKTKGFRLHDYQVEVAAWGARRMGAVFALGCGVGKTATAVASAIAAVRLKRCQDTRVFIVCPVNAFGTWGPFLPELKEYFKDVQIVSVDSVHHLASLAPEPGGAVIFDEAHKQKNTGNVRRTIESHAARRCFEWGTCLSGSLLHTGVGGVLSVQDLACPGLSRYMEEMAFGRAFKCIIMKQLGKQTKRKLGLVSELMQPFFVDYLKRSVRSLSYQSPEVSISVKLPGRTMVTVDEWHMPEEIKANKDKFCWGPELDWATLLGRLALAIKERTDREIISQAHALGGDPVCGVEAAVQILTAAAENPFTEVALVEPIRKLLKQKGLPAFGRVMFEACRLGRFNYWLEQTETKGEDDAKRISWRFTSDTEEPGPKLIWVRSWLEQNGSEPVVVGAQGSRTVAGLAKMFDGMKVSYRIVEGGTPIKDRQQFVEDFENDKFQVMLLQQVAGSESVQLTRASTSILVDHDWSAISYEQFLARTYRQGQKRECEHFDLSFNTVQAEVIRKLVRGCSFDAETRAELEKQVNYARIIQTLQETT